MAADFAANYQVNFRLGTPAAMSVRIVRLGSPRLPAEGLRIGTVRRPPRGVAKAELATRELVRRLAPELAPSPAP